MTLTEFQDQEELFKAYRRQREEPWFKALLEVLEGEHPVRLTTTPPSAEGHALCQGYERALQLLKRVDAVDVRSKAKPFREPTEEEMAMDPNKFLGGFET